MTEWGDGSYLHHTLARNDGLKTIVAVWKPYPAVDSQ
jgi:hypothetical protein